jgi:hypothetical protein
MNVNRFMPLTHIVIQIILKSNKMSSLGNPNGNHRPLIVSKDRFLIGLVGQIGVQIPILYPLRFERMLTMSFSLRMALFPGLVFSNALVHIVSIIQTHRYSGC